MFLFVCASVTAFVVAMLSVSFYPVENPDCAARYALMAEAFAHGDWYGAFHPRFCVLFQVLTGFLVWAIGCSGVAACQIVSAAFLGVATIPYWHVMRRLFGDDRVAWFSLAVLLALPRISGDAMNGLRDTGRILAIAMWVLGILKAYDGKRGMLLQAGGLFVLVSLKIDCFLPAAFMCLFSAVTAVRKRSWMSALVCIAAFLAAAAAVCTMVWSYTGWFVPAPQYIAFIKGIL